VRGEATDATSVELVLPSGAVLRRLLVRHGDAHGVYDKASDDGALVRWNLPIEVDVVTDPGATSVRGDGWHAAFTHAAAVRILVPDAACPRSGWRSPTYGLRAPLTALELRVDGAGRAGAWFGPSTSAPTTLAPWDALEAESDAALATFFEE
jgi:hypothetical protein